MKYAKFRVTLDVVIDKQGVDNQVIKANMQNIVMNAMHDGTITGDLESTVELYNYKVEVIDNMDRI